MATIRYIACHHFGGTKDPYAKTQGFGENVINNAHRTNWPNFKSSMGTWIGYNFIIYPNGSLKQYRPIGAQTAAQRGFNFNTVSICLAGNFNKRSGQPIERPTRDQRDRLKTLMWDLTTKRVDKYVVEPKTTLAMTVTNIYPHSFFNSTECYGSSLDKNWARNLMIEVLKSRIELLNKLIALYRQLIDARRKKEFGRISLSALDNSCSGNVTQTE